MFWMIKSSQKTNFQEIFRVTKREKKILVISLLTLAISSFILYIGFIERHYFIIIASTLIFVLSFLKIVVVVWISHTRKIQEKSETRVMQ
jgi:hypothetical protein